MYFIVDNKWHMPECDNHFDICAIPEWGIFACQLSDYWNILREDGLAW